MPFLSTTCGSGNQAYAGTHSENPARLAGLAERTGRFTIASLQFVFFSIVRRATPSERTRRPAGGRRTSSSRTRGSLLVLLGLVFYGTQAMAAEDLVLTKEGSARAQAVFGYNTIVHTDDGAWHVRDLALGPGCSVTAKLVAADPGREVDIGMDLRHAWWGPTTDERVACRPVPTVCAVDTEALAKAYWSAVGRDRARSYLKSACSVQNPDAHEHTARDSSPFAQSGGTVLALLVVAAALGAGILGGRRSRRVLAMVAAFGGGILRVVAMSRVESLWSELVVRERALEWRLDAFHPPLHGALVKAMSAVYPEASDPSNLFLLRLINLVPYALIVASIWHIGRNWRRESAATAAIVLYSLAPRAIYADIQAANYALEAALVMCFLAFLVHAATEPGRRSWVPVAAAGVASIWAGWMAILFVAPGLAWAALFRMRRNGPRSVLPMIVGVGLALVPLAFRLVTGLSTYHNEMAGRPELQVGWQAPLLIFQGFFGDRSIFVSGVVAAIAAAATLPVVIAGFVAPAVLYCVQSGWIGLNWENHGSLFVPLVLLVFAGIESLSRAAPEPPPSTARRPLPGRSVRPSLTRWAIASVCLTALVVTAGAEVDSWRLPDAQPWFARERPEVRLFSGKRTRGLRVLADAVRRDGTSGVIVALHWPRCPTYDFPAYIGRSPSGQLPAAQPPRVVSTVGETRPLIEMDGRADSASLSTILEQSGATGASTLVVACAGLIEERPPVWMERSCVRLLHAASIDGIADVFRCEPGALRAR